MFTIAYIALLQIRHCQLLVLDTLLAVFPNSISKRGAKRKTQKFPRTF